MDYKFLNKVVDQIVNETRLDYEKERAHSPSLPTFMSSFHSLVHRPFRSFTKHCKEVYGLNEDETDYVWNEYKEIIRDKVNNG